jgi:predicted DNA-binding transcriptional regulator AlpA
LEYHHQIKFFHKNNFIPKAIASYWLQWLFSFHLPLIFLVSSLLRQKSSLQSQTSLSNDKKGGQYMSKDSKIPEIQELPEGGLVRIKQVLKFVPVSRSTWWSGVRDGRFPKPFKLSERVTVWRVSDIRAVVEGK